MRRIGENTEVRSTRLWVLNARGDVCALGADASLISRLRERRPDESEPIGRRLKGMGSCVGRIEKIETTDAFIVLDCSAPSNH